MNQLFDEDFEPSQVSLFDFADDEKASQASSPKYMFYDDEIANSNQYICAVGYVCTDERGNELFRNYELIDPECDFGVWETRTHGLTATDVSGKMNFQEFCESTRFLDLLEHCVFVAHNAKGADFHHIRKSLAHYGIDMPRVRVIDTQDLASRIIAFEGESLEAACGYYGIELKEHHNALEDALACREIFWRMMEEQGECFDAENYIPGESRGRALKRNRPNGSLGLVCGSTQTIEELLDEFDDLGLLANIEEIIDIGPCAMKFSGTANGMSSDEIEYALQARGYGSGAKKTVTGNPGKKTVFFAVGDNVGPSKVKTAKENGTRVIGLADLLNALGI